MGTLRRFFDHLHLVQLPLAAPGHAGGGHPGLVPGYEVFQLGHFLLLPYVGRFQLGLVDLVQFLEFVVIAGVPCQLAVLQMVDYVGHVVQEGHVVGDQDKGVFVILQKACEPPDVFHVQIIGRFVQ